MNEKEQVTKIETVQAGLTSSWKGYKKKNGYNEQVDNFFQCVHSKHTPTTIILNT